MLFAPQAAAQRAPQLSREEMRRMRQQRDPNFRAKAAKQAPAGAQEAATDGGAAPAEGPAADGGAGAALTRAAPPKRKKGLGFTESRDAKRARAAGDEAGAASAADSMRGEPGGGGGGVAAPEATFASAGPQDVSTINDEGEPMDARATAPPQPAAPPQAGGEGAGTPGPGAGRGQNPDGGPGAALGEAAPSPTAFVKNLPHGCGEGELAALFEGACAVRLPRDKFTNRLKARGS